MTDAKTILCNIYEFFKYEAKHGPRISVSRPYARLLAATGCSKGYIHKSLKDEVEPKPCDEVKVAVSSVCIVVLFISIKTQ